MCVGGGETDRQTDKQRHRHRHTETERKRHRERQRQRDKQRERHRHRHRQTDKPTDRQRACVYAWVWGREYVSSFKLVTSNAVYAVCLNVNVSPVCIGKRYDSQLGSVLKIIHLASR